MLKSRSKGEIAVLKVQLRCYEKNLVVSLPTNNEIYYDIIIDNPNNATELKRAQIKYCNRKSSDNKKNLELILGDKKSKRIYYLKTDIQWILVYIPQLDVVLKYEQKQFHRKKTIQINLTNPSSIWYYKKYIW